MSTEGMPGFNLVDLPTADRGDKLKTVQRDDSAARALTIMIADEFSQVPIVSGKRGSRGRGHLAVAGLPERPGQHGGRRRM